MAATAVLANPEQRRYRRFKLSYQLRYAIRSGPAGEGQLVDIGSGGLFFRCNAILPAGRLIQVVLRWPLLLDGQCPLTLWIRGRILRSDPTGTAIELRKYEFRTAGRSRFKAAAAPPKNG